VLPRLRFALAPLFARALAPLHRLVLENFLLAALGFRFLEFPLGLGLLQSRGLLLSLPFFRR
jgi:hypothetical protein